MSVENKNKEENAKMMEAKTNENKNSEARFLKLAIIKKSRT